VRIELTSPGPKPDDLPLADLPREFDLSSLNMRLSRSLDGRRQVVGLLIQAHEGEHSGGPKGGRTLIHEGLSFAALPNVGVPALGGAEGT
jgi:hypothetical protein